MLSQNYHTCIRGNSNSAIFLIDLLELKEYIVAPKDRVEYLPSWRKLFMKSQKNSTIHSLQSFTPECLRHYFIALPSFFCFYFLFFFSFDSDSVSVFLSLSTSIFFLRISSKKSSVSVGYSGAIPNDNSSYPVFRWF